MSDSNQVTRHSDEIDLLDLFRSAGRAVSRFFISVGRGILISTLFLLKNWLPLGVSIITGIGLSYLLKFGMGPTFRSDLVVRSNVTTADEMITYINRLHAFCSEGNLNAIGTALNLSDQYASLIKDIKAYYIIDLNSDTTPDYVDYKSGFDVFDTASVRMDDRLSIRVKVRDPVVFKEIRNGILYFVSSDSLFQQRNRVRLKQRDEMLGRLNYDIRQLDSLQKVKYFEETRNRIPQNGGQIVFLQEQTTQLVYNDIYALYYRKQGIEAGQILYRDIITITSDFTIPAKPATRMLYYGMFAIPAAFLVTLLYLIARRNRQKLQEVYRKA